jgi:pimeloyl-ACP methyl ester carboxylesterase
MERLSKIAMWVALLISPLAVKAQDPGAIRDAIEFHEILRKQLPSSLQDNINLSMIHMIPNQQISELPLAVTLNDAMKKVAPVKLSDLIANNRVTPASHAPAVAGAVPTLVVVPGLFADLLPELAFADVLEGSADKSGSVVDDYFEVGFLKDAQGIVTARLVVMHSPSESLESLDDLPALASRYNLRLEEFLNRTGYKNIILIGSGQGANVALEMLSQAGRQNLGWLADVEAMVSWAGWLWGTSVADEALTPGTAANAVIEELRSLQRKIDPRSPTRSLVFWNQTVVVMGRLIPEVTKNKTYPDAGELELGMAEAGGLDAWSLWQTLSRWANEVKFRNGNGDNVRDFQMRLDKVLNALQQSTTVARVTWWQTHSLPKHISYYAMTAAMANPKAGALEREAFEGPWGYGPGTYDDRLLLQWRLDDEARTGVSLSDGEVVLPQAVFLPGVLSALNPSLQGLKTVMLGTCGTHAWGMVMPTVNKMKAPRANQFPRGAMLRSLVEKLTLDRRKSP